MVSFMRISGEGKFGILIGLVSIAGAGLIMLAPDRPWESAWREDHRRDSNGFQVDSVAALAMRNPLVSISADTGKEASPKPKFPHSYR